MFFIHMFLKYFPKFQFKKIFKEIEVDKNTSSKNQTIQLKICELSIIIGGMNKNGEREKELNSASLASAPSQDSEFA